MKMLFRIVQGALGAFDRTSQSGLILGPTYDDPEALAARAALDQEGNWQPLRASIAKAGKNWARRSFLIGIGGEYPTLQPWIEDWLAKEPKKSAPHLVAATNYWHYAGALRGDGWSNTVSDKGMEGMYRNLTKAYQYALKATKIAPRDPTPWSILTGIARPMQQSRERIDLFFKNAVKLAPEHFTTHQQMLQYVCEKWFGSHDEMWDFVKRATADLPFGSLLYSLIPAAHIENAIMECDDPDEYFDYAHVRSAVKAAFRQMHDGADQNSPHAVPAYNTFAYALTSCEAYKDARVAFGVLRNRMTETPWGYYGLPARSFKKALAKVEIQ